MSPNIRIFSRLLFLHGLKVPGFLFVLLLFHLTNPLAAQEQRKTLETILKTPDLPDSTRVRALSELGWNFRNTYKDSATYFLEAAVESAQAESLLVDRLKVLNRLIALQIDQGQYYDAFNRLEALLQIAEEKGIEREIAYAYINLASGLVKNRNYKLAITNATRAKNIFEKLDYNPAMGLADLIIAEAYFLDGQAATAKAFLAKSIDYFSELSHTDYLIEALQLEAKIALSGGKWTEADEALRIADRYLDKASNTVAWINQQTLRARLALAEGNILLSESQLLEVLNEPEVKHNPLLHYEVLHQLGTSYRGAGDFEKSLNYQKQADSIMQGVHLQNASRWMLNIQNMVLNQANSREKSQLFQQQIEDEKALKVARERLQFLIVLGAGFFIAIVLLFINGAKAKRQNQRLLEINRAYQELQAELLRQQRELEAKQVEIEEKNSNLQAMDKEKDEIMSLVAHDLKSPLANINSLIQLIQSDIISNEEKNSYLSTIKNITSDGIHLINDLLTINRIESKTYKKHLKDFSFPELMDAILKTFEPQAASKGIILHRDDHIQGEGIIHSDPLTVRRILDNLLSNAIKFSKASTMVTIKSEAFPFHMKIQIIDEGPGISKEEQEALFKKFSRAGAQPTGGEPSSGLGLYIAKILTEELHGDLTVQSEKGEGAIFTLNFPR